MSTEEQHGQVEVKVNTWVTIPMLAMLIANGVFNIAMSDWSEVVLSCLMIVIGLMFIEREKAVASLLIVNRTLQVSLIQVLEKVVQLEKESNGQDEEVSRD